MWPIFVFLANCTLLAHLAEAVNPDSAESKIAGASRIEKLLVGRDQTGKVYWLSSCERQNEEKLTTPEHCSELADKHGSLRGSKKDRKVTVQDPAGELRSSNGLCAPVDQQIGISNIGHTFADSLYGMVDTEFFTEWDPMRELYEPAPPHEWNSEEETSQEAAPPSILEQPKEDSSLEQVSKDSSLKQVNNDSSPEQVSEYDSLEQVSEDSSLEQSKESQEATADEESTEDKVQEIVRFKRFKTPKDFVDHWEEQERLFESLARPLSAKQKHELRIHYYRFAKIGRMFKEMGKKAFLKKYGKSTITKMREDAAVEIRRRKVAAKNPRAAASGGAARDSSLEIVRFRRPKSPKDFVDHREEQVRLFEGLPRPLSTEQKYELTRNYYPFTRPGKLLKELGNEAFLKKYGKNFVEHMLKDVAAEIKRREAAEKDQIAVDEESAEDNIQEIAKFRRFKTPKDFADNWEDQERLFKSLPHPPSAKQKCELKNNYYRFTQAGRMLKELGKEAFLEKYGKSTVTQMQRDVAAEIKRREAAEEDQRLAADEESAENKDSGIVRFRRPASPKDFANHWEEQVSLFESLPHPFSTEQKRELTNSYYRFTQAGRMLKELGKETFLKTYGKGSITKMRKNVAAEVKRREAAEKRGLVAGAKGAKKVPDVVTSTSSESSEDSVRPRPKRRRTREPKQVRRVPTLEECSDSEDTTAQTRTETMITKKRKRIAKESARTKNGSRTRDGDESTR